MKEVTNNSMQPVTLDDGTILAAAGTEGSTKPISSLSERDDRLVRRRLITILDLSIKAVPPPASTKTARAPEKETAVRNTGRQE